eukprot:182515-Karenia_brevis.AAC.1
MGSMLESRLRPIQAKVDSHDEVIQHLQWQVQQQRKELDEVKSQLCKDSGAQSSVDVHFDHDLDTTILRLW